MDLTSIMEFIINNGIAVVVVAYFLWKDSTLTKENTSILQQVKTLLETLLNQKGDKNEDN
jgi:hypothetical protein